MLTKAETVFLAISIVFAETIWGVLISLPPPFYPSEAEKKGATPSQVRFTSSFKDYSVIKLSPKYL